MHKGAIVTGLGFVAVSVAVLGGSARTSAPAVARASTVAPTRDATATSKPDGSPKAVQVCVYGSVAQGWVCEPSTAAAYALGPRECTADTCYVMTSGVHGGKAAAKHRTRTVRDEFGHKVRVCEQFTRVYYLGAGKHYAWVPVKCGR